MVQASLLSPKLTAARAGCIRQKNRQTEALIAICLAFLFLQRADKTLTEKNKTADHEQMFEWYLFVTVSSNEQQIKLNKLVGDEASDVSKTKSN